MQNKSIVNFYEHLVFDNIQEMLVDTGKVTTTETVLDIACLALNRLPARYVRHHIDALFYLSDEEREKMHADVAAAVRTGFEVVLASPRGT